ncbi:uncharacterized protein THITE_2110891 [Thermothielavioides terrestris NRRL 8126]|uniref:DUF7702 domain-containing protein n=1 Tax=Thermothielavioides terrestris (strain ATCC 38088 / NRRL 8126) TaxID=578455 RepID=G2QUZ6_THETT|nr:uncharacterized protein THITE_2110891 [Thermothielavioides terrestris NRRL 8126]AEO64594.1 hypothetical protein THITE_2110891 [Thermothielavioides terrestris NRRL 8126]
MGLDASNIVAAVEIAVYVPALILSILLCIRHGFRRSSGWFYLFALCLIRIVGGACQLATLSNDSIGLIETAIILDRIGLTPLMLATLGLLSRLYVLLPLVPASGSSQQLTHELLSLCRADWINQASATPFLSTLYFRLVQLLIVLGAVLSIVGVTNSIDDSSAAAAAQSGSSSAISDAAVIMYVAAYVGLVAILLVCARAAASAVPKGERVVVPAVFAALPFLAVRLLYQLLTVFVHSGVFVRVGGPVGVRVGMALAEEFVVIAIYLLLGFRLDRISADQQGPVMSRPWKDRDDGGRRRRRRRHGDSRTDYAYERSALAEDYPMEEHERSQMHV